MGWESKWGMKEDKNSHCYNFIVLQARAIIQNKHLKFPVHLQCSIDRLTLMNDSKMHVAS